MTEIKPFVFGEAANTQGAFVFQPVASTTGGEEDKKTEELTDEQAKEEAERDAGVHFDPVVHLDVIQTVSSEENENEIFKMRAKLFRFDSENKEWKERGVGDVRFLEHKNTHRVRILMRQEKTLKVRLNHYVTPGLELDPMSSSDRAWKWYCPNDFADEEPHPDLFAIRFANHENALKFRDAFEDAIARNAKLMEAKKEEEKKEEK